MVKRPPMSGVVLQASVLDLASRLKWRAAHFRPARTENGWRTPVAADGKGYPDLHLVRERSIFAEIKGDGDTLSVEQETWLAWLRAAGHEVYVFTPESWRSGEVDRILSRREPTAAPPARTSDSDSTTDASRSSRAATGGSAAALSGHDASGEVSTPADPEAVISARRPARFRGHEEGRGWRPIPDAESLEQAAKLAPWATAVSVIHTARTDDERPARPRRKTTMTGGRR